jgi:hypothetical protein
MEKDLQSKSDVDTPSLEKFARSIFKDTEVVFSSNVVGVICNGRYTCYPLTDNQFVRDNGVEAKLVTHMCILVALRKAFAEVGMKGDHASRLASYEANCVRVLEETALPKNWAKDVLSFGRKNGVFGKPNTDYWNMPESVPLDSLFLPVSFKEDTRVAVPMSASRHDNKGQSDFFGCTFKCMEGGIGRSFLYFMKDLLAEKGIWIGTFIRCLRGRRYNLESNAFFQLETVMKVMDEGGDVLFGMPSNEKRAMFQIIVESFIQMETSLEKYNIAPVHF